MTFIERVSTDRPGAWDEIYRWKKLHADGWDVTVLHEPARKSLIAFGYRRHA